MPTDDKQGANAPRLPTAAEASLGLWFVLLAFGGACLAWYYSSIHYFPMISWQESVTYLAVLSIVGGALVLSFGLLVFMPGVVWSEVLLSDCRLGDKLRYERADGEQEPCLWTIFWKIGMPFALFMIAYHLLTTFDVKFTDAGTISRITVSIGGAALLIAIATRLFVHQIKKILDMSCSADANRYSIHKYVAAFVGSTLFGVAALGIIGELINAPDQWGRTILMGLVCTAIIVAANIFVSMIYGTSKLAAVMVAIFAALTIVVAGEWVEADDSLLHKIVGSYGLGESNRYVLIVTNEGREQLAAQGVGAETVPMVTGGSLGRLRDVAILSRLGETYFFRWCGQGVELQKRLVASWSSELTNEEILHWVRDGRAESDILREIEQAAGVNFKVTKPDLKRLRKDGVSSAVIRKMQERESTSSRCDRPALKTRVAAGPPGWERADEPLLARARGGEP